MYDVLFHEILDSTDDLVHNGDGSYLLDLIMFGQKAEEVSMLAVLSDDVAMVVCSVDVVALYDVRMVKGSKDLYLHFLHLESWVTTILEVDYFDRAFLVGSGVGSFVDDAAVSPSYLVCGLIAIWTDLFLSRGSWLGWLWSGKLACVSQTFCSLQKVLSGGFNVHWW